MNQAASSNLPSNAERQAAKAEGLTAFGGLNLTHIRKQVAQFLSLIGREGIFDQYTVHDITHIDKMLASLDWIIPESTKQVMSPADWLMTTLAIYFHDLGMLVTAREYDARASSDFPRFCKETLYGGPDGDDYKAKVLSLGADRSDRFLYQEWVRYKHAERIKAWITGTERKDLGEADEVFSELNMLLGSLGKQFRRDLGLICESHHLNDLNDLKKYKPSQPYGDSDAETVNLQYCAVLLRTADLLHITSDRTPSTVFKVINPTDPISQQEWAKQMAVKRLRPKIAVNEDGILDEKAAQDTIEVHAYFTDDNGFFGLTSYLSYASTELKRSHEWVSGVLKQNLAKHEFPWRKIDDSHIETEGFIRDSFEFTIDQAKILDLLTGHTLYNDTRVVLRELVQNALDAIRLRYFPNKPSDGKVSIYWNSRDRELSVRDNGTGMSQADISNFLLRVGTSRYQDPEFKKRYPGFSSISRFGIGVLSAFMIADSVEITTCHPDDEQARQLTLRSVHGKYLIRLLNKTDELVRSASPHGSEFKLRIRPSVKMPDVAEIARLWVVFPECRVEVRVDDEAPVAIGYKSPAEALSAILLEQNIESEIASDQRAPETPNEGPIVRIFHAKKDGVEVAYAVEWVKFFREWAFLSGDKIQRKEGGERLLGTCLEGIRVEFATPGFQGTPIVSIANVRGPSSPKTNVARSGLEATTERDLMLRSIYEIYTEHVANEVEELQSNRSFSLTWAAEEARIIMRPLFVSDNNRSSDVRAISPALLREYLGKLRILPVEEGGQRQAISPDTLKEMPVFWTIESGLLQSAEPLIREASAAASLARVISNLDLPAFAFPNEAVLCGVPPTGWFGPFAYQGREVDRIDVHHSQRRVDLRWTKDLKPGRWVTLPELNRLLHRRTLARIASSREVAGAFMLSIGADDITVNSNGSEIAVRAFNQFYIYPHTSVATYLKKILLASPSDDWSDEELLVAIFVCDLVVQCLQANGPSAGADIFVRRRARFWELEPFIQGSGAHVDINELIDLVATEKWVAFNPLAWRRSTETV